MDYLWLGCAAVLLVIGMAAVLVPGIPGPLIGFAGLAVAQLSDLLAVSGSFLLGMLAVAVCITVLDSIVPIWGTRKWGGSRAGVIGSTIGLLAALFVLPAMGIVLGPFGLLGIVLGPFVGALLGELLVGTGSRQALRAAFGSFVGFVTGTLLKLAYTAGIAGYLVYALVRAR